MKESRDFALGISVRSPEGSPSALPPLRGRGTLPSCPGSPWPLLQNALRLLIHRADSRRSVLHSSYFHSKPVRLPSKAALGPGSIPRSSIDVFEHLPQPALGLACRGSSDMLPGKPAHMFLLCILISRLQLSLSPVMPGEPAAVGLQDFTHRMNQTVAPAFCTTHQGIMYMLFFLLKCSP